MQEEEYNIEQLQERERSIRQLESDIVDVNTIFKDLATMVHEQVALRQIRNILSILICNINFAVKFNKNGQRINHRI